jgi:hypothetical protein
LATSVISCWRVAPKPIISFSELLMSATSCSHTEQKSYARSSQKDAKNAFAKMVTS